MRLHFFCGEHFALHFLGGHFCWFSGCDESSRSHVPMWKFPLAIHHLRRADHYLLLAMESCACCRSFILAPPLQVCAGCYATVYCGRVCQKRHWKKHKPTCLRLRGYVPCVNVASCKTWTSPDEHPDLEYCNFCGEPFPIGVCMHFGTCECRSAAR